MLKLTNIGPVTGKKPNYGINDLLNKGEVDWGSIEKQFDWVAPMQNCMQDHRFHAEGDVWTHTKMVVEELMKFEEFQELQEEEQYILFLSALLHDIAKPICTITDDEGYIRSPRHAKVGEKVVRQLLWGADFEARELISGLVRLHGLPLWGIRKSNPNTSIMSSSLRLPNNWLYLLAKADVLGRISADQENSLFQVELFKELCIENDCWELPKNFHNEHSKFRFFFKREEHPAELYDDTDFEILILSGIAGSGKDTYASQFDLPMISLDDIRKQLKIKHTDKKGQGKVAQYAYTLAKSYAAKKQPFIWNSTNLTSDLRMRVIRALSVYNPRFKLAYIETSEANIQARRGATIPKKNIRSMFRLLEMPMPYEVHEIEYFRN
ncbi:MAG: AAA family ATPase [Aureispira sp.]|nr:AAA family ATPase [Aureispira sp.]